MFCYGKKEPWFKSLVPSGMLPALAIGDHLVTESDRILETLEDRYGVLAYSMREPSVLKLRHLERQLFRAWCQWLCDPSIGSKQDELAKKAFQRIIGSMVAALESTAGPFLLDRFSTVDIIFIPYLERMSASLAYYKGFLLRHQHPAIERWFEALEERDSYLATQGDFHTHAHSLPPQMGGCYANHTPEQQWLADRVDSARYPIVDAKLPDPETRVVPPENAWQEALARVLKHREVLMRRIPLPKELMEPALRSALTLLALGRPSAPPAGAAAGLRYLRDRISVPRDMSLHAARVLRQALEATAQLDPECPQAQGPPIPTSHRLDQDPAPFLEAVDQA